MTTPLTPALAERLRWIEKFFEAHGHAPTRPEMCAEFRISLNAAQQSIYKLQDHGALKITRGKHRGLELVRKAGGRRARGPTFILGVRVA